MRRRTQGGASLCPGLSHFAPLGRGNKKNPTARGLFPISCQIYDAIFGLERRTFLMTNPNMPDKKVIAVVGSGTQVTLS